MWPTLAVIDIYGKFHLALANEAQLTHKDQLLSSSLKVIKEAIRNYSSAGPFITKS